MEFATSIKLCVPAGKERRALGRGQDKKEAEESGGERQRRDLSAMVGKYRRQI
jgi:hypothetical protein